MKHLSAILTVLLVAGSIGCSKHNRTADTPLTPADVQTLLQDVEGGAQGSSTGSGSVTDALAYKDKESAVIYVAFAPQPKIRVANVVSFLRFDFLGATNAADLGYANISDARVIFIDAIENGQHVNALIIGIKSGSDSFTYYSFTGTGGVGGGEFTASLTGSTGITLQSFDVQDGDLSGVIQLKLYSGDEYLGKVPSLQGFSL